MMTSRDIRQSFVDFFVARGHRVHASAPLVPRGDATLLFTNAGMVPFKDYFLGLEQPEVRRAVSVQKCLRVSGKHNDLENVGPSPRHHTFFEMLGNFSFGDYFKAEAIEYGWRLVTDVWGLDPALLSATVYEQDEEAARLWASISTLPAGRIHRCGKKDNFWAMGDTGPCGPCSEIFVDRAPHLPAVAWEEGTESGRYLEIWNLVFMQYDRQPSGEMVPLPNPSIDTGAGLERVAAVLQGVDSNYDTDLFQPVLRATAALAATEYGRDAERDVSMRVIADHLRAVTFLLADGVIPGNEGRGYVLRRILRRAARHGMRLGFEEPFLHRLVAVLGETMGAAYPELAGTREATVETVRAEEEKFLATVATASQKVQESIEETKSRGDRALPGDAVFRLYDTYGLPLELIREIAEEERLGVDQAGFEAALETQRERSRGHLSGGAARAAALKDELARKGMSWERTRLLGEETTPGWTPREDPASAAVVAVGRFQAAGPDLGGTLRAGEEGFVLLDRTSFYAEAGGQVGDRGTIAWDGGQARVTDTQTILGDRVHFVAVERGELRAAGEPRPEPQRVRLAVDAELRRATQRNHTATHLLHAALRQVLGPAVRQMGSLVAPDRLRFDFSHPEPMRPAERDEVEARVNRWILEAIETRVAVTSQEEALARGAMALFGEKYGQRVRTIDVPGVSLELCGGCHVRNTGEIGLFVLLSEKGVASGVRRIEALTGDAARAWARQRDAGLAALEELLGAPAERLPEEIAGLRERLRQSERALAAARLAAVAGGAGSGAAAEQVEVAGIRLLAREVPDAPAGDLRSMADALRSKLGSGVVVLGTRGDGKASLLAAVTADLKDRVSAADLVRRLAPRIDGSGGGRPDFAQAGGKRPEGLGEALAEAADVLRTLAGG